MTINADKKPGQVDLSGRTAIVTGAGSGIGRAISLSLASAGAQVLVQDIVADRVGETIDLIVKAGGEALPAYADISNETEVEDCIAQAAKRWGRIDILCNNAGIVDRMELPAEISTAMWNRVLAVNLTGPFFMSRAVLPHMLARKAGSIINTASIASLRGGAAGLAYTASKHGVIGLTRSIAWAHGPDGIRCNAICPGPTRTNIGAEESNNYSVTGVARLMPVISLADRHTGPESMANLALFLASDAAEYLNGAIIPVDGGWMAG